MPGPMRAAMRRRLIPNTPSVTRVITVMAAEQRRDGSHRHVPPTRVRLAVTGTARPVPGAAGRHGTARCPGLDGVSVFLAGEVAARSPDRLSQWQYHHPRGGHRRTWHCHDLG